MDIGLFLNRFRILISVLWLGLVVFLIWLYVGGRPAYRGMLRIVYWLPGAAKVARNLDAARTCGGLFIHMVQGVPLTEAFSNTAAMAESKPLSDALMRISSSIEKGQTAAEAIKRERVLDNLLALTFEHAPEKELAEEFQRLSELYEHRATLCARSATLLWTAIAFIVMSLIVGVIVLSLFLPNIKIIVGLAG
jgi:type II secretory pathway component PulF